MVFGIIIRTRDISNIILLSQLAILILCLLYSVSTNIEVTHFKQTRKLEYYYANNIGWNTMHFYNVKYDEWHII